MPTITNVTVAVDSTQENTPSTRTLTHDNDGNGLVRLVLQVMDTQSTSAAFTATADYGGVAMTEVARSEAGNGSRDDIPCQILFELEDPPTGSNDFDVDFEWETALPIDSTVLIGISVDSDGGTGDTGSDTADNPVGTLNPALTTGEDGSLVIVAFGVQGADVFTSGFTVGTGYTEEAAGSSGTNAGVDISYFVQSQEFATAGAQSGAATWVSTDDASALSFEILPGATGPLESTATLAATTAVAATTETDQEATVEIAATTSVAATTETTQEATAAIAATTSVAAATELVTPALESTATIAATTAVAATTETNQETTAEIAATTAVAAATETTQEVAATIAATTSIAAATEALLETTAIISAVTAVAASVPTAITTDASIDAVTSVAATTAIIGASTVEIAATTSVAAITETTQEVTALIAAATAVNAVTEGGEQPTPTVERDVDGPPAPAPKLARRKRRKLSKNQQRAKDREEERRRVALERAIEEDDTEAMAAIQTVVQALLDAGEL